MKISTDFLLICENAISTNDGKVSLINIFEEIKGPQLPLIYGPIYLVSRFNIHGTATKKTKLAVDVSLTDPDNEQISIDSKIDSLDVEPHQDSIKKGIILNIPIIKFDKEGLYKVSLTVDKLKIGDFEIKSIKTNS